MRKQWIILLGIVGCIFTGKTQTVVISDDSGYSSISTNTIFDLIFFFILI